MFEPADLVVVNLFKINYFYIQRRISITITIQSCKDVNQPFSLVKM